MTLAPTGLTGNWKLVFHDEFTENREDAGDKWVVTNWQQNDVISSPRNVWTWGGKLVLNLASADSGAHIYAKDQLITPGMVVEARIKFPGSLSTIYNWPAFWTAGVRYPESGEHDIAEGIGGLKISYWTGAKELGFSEKPPGSWADDYIVCTLHRGKMMATVRWNGRLLAKYDTKDDGGPQRIYLTLGSRGHAIIDKASRVRVDYVRAWKPA